MNEPMILNQTTAPTGEVISLHIGSDDMAPEFPVGARVLARKVDETAFLEWGEVYILDTENGQIMKRINPTATKSSILCVSINEKYPAFELKLSDIFGFYRVYVYAALK